MLLRCLIRSRETMHLGKTLRFKKITSDAWHVGAGSAIIEGVCCGSFSTVLGCRRHVRVTPQSRPLERTSQSGSFVPTTVIETD
jgi:hypothetical protein